MRPEMLKQHTSVAGFTFALGNEKVDSPNSNRVRGARWDSLGGKSAASNFLDLSQTSSNELHTSTTAQSAKIDHSESN
jgi:hypothetical protein